MVYCPVVLFFGSAQFVTTQWLEHGIEESLAVDVQHLAEVEAERFGNRQQNRDVENKLNPA